MKKKYILIVFLTITLLSLLLIYSMQYKDKNLLENELLNGSIDEYSYIFKDLKNKYIVYNKSRETCKIYLLDNNKEILLDDFSLNTESCSLVLRLEDVIIYRGQDDYSLPIKYPRQNEFYNSNIYYYNIRDKESLSLYTPQDNEYSKFDFLVLSDDTKRAALVVDNKLFLYNLEDNNLITTKEFTLAKPLSFNSLYQKMVEVNQYFNQRIIISEIATLDENNQRLIYKSKEIFEFADGSYLYSITFDLNTGNYEEILEKVNE